MPAGRQVQILNNAEIEALGSDMEQCTEDERATPRPGNGQLSLLCQTD